MKLLAFSSQPKFSALSSPKPSSIKTEIQFANTVGRQTTNAFGESKRPLDTIA